MSQPIVPCTVRLSMFEGPLDLLLHLIKKNEVQVTDIPIATITDQYLATLEQFPELNLDGAGEYLVMAATLAYIKSRLLLPGSDDDEPEEDPRTELVQQLVEYQRFREVAVALGERPLLARDVFAAPGEGLTPPSADEVAPLPVREASLGDLLVALRDVLQRLQPPPMHQVAREEYTVQGAVAEVLARFAHTTEVEFGTLFPADAARGRVIVTFLALLELIRLKVVRAVQPARFGPITLGLAVATLDEAAERVRDLTDQYMTTPVGPPSQHGGGGGEGENADGSFGHH
jgi:segregation and condensation protein A